MANEYTTVIDDSGDADYTKRILIGVPATGLVRMEWVQARYGQIIPINWSHVEMLSWMSGYVPMRYQVADAQNLIIKAAVEQDYKWVLLYEHDVIPPPNAFITLGEYMRDKSAPIVSGLYYTRSRPSEPLVFRGRGNSYYGDWKHGDKVWVDGAPTGFLLISVDILKAMWDESPEYIITRAGQSVIVRRIFETPRKLTITPDGGHNALNGTSDLDWCSRVIEGDFIRKAGWTDFADSLEDERYPILIDTNLFCHHINTNGEQFP